MAGHTGNANTALMASIRRLLGIDKRQFIQGTSDLEKFKSAPINPITRTPKKSSLRMAIDEGLAEADKDSKRKK